MITFFRILVILFCFIAISTVVAHDIEQPLLKFVGVLGLVVLVLALLLFANLCGDMKHLINRDENYSVALLGKDPQIENLLSPTKSGGSLELGNVQLRDVGDRKFKANATKVCKTCKWIDEPGKTCRKDDLSLEGITISAVGCQYWALGLTVTETEPRPEETSDDESGENNEEK